MLHLAALAVLLLTPSVLGAACPVVAAQSALVGQSNLKASYLKPKFGQSRANIDSYTEKTINNLIAGVDASLGQFKWENPWFFWPSANGWTSIAKYDHDRGTRTFYDAVSKSNDALAKSNQGCGSNKAALVNCFNDDAGWAGLASLEAYEAYGDQKFLDRAIGVWQYLTDHGLVTQKVINDGYLKGIKNPDVKVQATCDGKSNIGGVYWQSGDSSDPKQNTYSSGATINAVSTGLYSQLGAALCRVTKDNKYCDAAYISIQWIERMMMTEDGLVMDNLHGGTCKVTNWVFTSAEETIPDNAALYISTYAQLGYATKNSTATRLAEKAALTAMDTTRWNDPTGIIKEGQGDAMKDDDGVGFKAILIRALHTAYPWVSSQVQANTVQYLNIQYYAITQLDSDSKTKPTNYGRNWLGPYVASTSKPNIVSLDVLNGIHLNPDSAFPSQSGSDVPVVQK